MKFNVRKISVLGLILSSNLCFAEPAAVNSITESNSAQKIEKLAEGESSSYVICKNGPIVRTIRIEKVGAKCRTSYTKEGQESIVGKSGTEELCREVFDKIRINLEKGDWKCRDITKSRVSSSE